MENSMLNKPKRPKPHRSSLIVTNFQDFNPNLNKDQKIDSIINANPNKQKRSSLGKNRVKFDEPGLVVNLEVPMVHEPELAVIKISKLATMRGAGTPAGLISKQVQQQNEK